jgi:hypothetical protein
MQFGENEFHIVHAESAGGVVRTVFGVSPSRLICDRDNLSCGPLWPLGDPEEWDRLRLAYWATMDAGESHGQTLWRQLAAARDGLDSAEAIYLWLGPALNECLLTGFVQEAFGLLELDLRRLRLIDLEPVFEAMGERQRLASFHNDYLRLMGPWRPMDEPMETCYRHIWRAATAPTPELLIDFCRPDTPWPAPLKEGMRAWLAWYPAVKSGLGFWDEMLLNNSGANPVTAAQTIAGCLRHSAGLVDAPGDGGLFHRLRRLADPGLAWPLLEMTGDGRTLRHTLTRLTDAGIDVLNGDENAIVLNGIEDRIGGVKLGLGEDQLWFYDGETLTQRKRFA